jgi:rare lipoprotein A
MTHALHLLPSCPRWTATPRTRAAARGIARCMPAAVLALAALGLAGCASRPPPAEADGPPLRVPPGLAQTPDAVPRVEPLRVGGPNRPYEINGRRHVPVADDRPMRERGGASWYGRKFHGLPTSSGEPFDMFAMTAAHRTMPIPSYAVVRHRGTGREIVVRVNDRGPFVDGRVIDLSYVAALRLGVLGGVAEVEVERLTHDDIRQGRWLAGRAPLPPDDPPPEDPRPAGPMAVAGPGFWLQLGAFRALDGAQTLQRQVAQGVQALGSAVAVRAEDGVFRVQAGPWPTREAAAAAAGALRQQLGLDSLVLHRP